MATSTAIVEKAANRLGIVSEGQTLRAEYDSDLTNAYNEVWAELDEMDLLTWDSDEDIPDAFVWSVVTMVAHSRLDEYSISNDRYTRIMNDYSKAHMRLKELVGSDAYQEQAEYF